LGLISCINIAAPNKNMHVKTRNLVPWFDNELVNLSKKRNQVYNKAIRSKLDIDWINFKAYRQSFSNVFRKKKSSFYKSIVASLKTQSMLISAFLDSLKNELQEDQKNSKIRRYKNL
jgi:hypothetical protein